MEHKIINRGINLCVFNTDKFKDLNIELRFIQKIDRKNATVRALLALMMQDRSFKYDTKQKMNKALDESYGASFNISCNGYGHGAMIRFNVCTIDQHFVDDELLQEQFAFIKEIILNPLLNENVFNEAKQALANELLRNEDDPKEYANKKALAIAGIDQPLGIDINGDIDVLKTIELADVKAGYSDMINNDHVFISLVGNIELCEAEALCLKYFGDLKSTTKSQYHYSFYRENSVKKIVEKNVEQTILTLVYNTCILANAERYWPLKIAVVMLGQLPNSLLFTEVREKNSLCYTIYSALLSYDSTMLISTGINYEDIAKAQLLIDKQIATIEKGEFSDFLFDSAKQMMINSYKSINDDPLSLINYAYTNHLLDSNDTIEGTIAKIEAVDRKAVMETFTTLRLNTTFILKNREDEDAENI